MDFGSIDAAIWAQSSFVYVCSPGNPHAA